MKSCVVCGKRITPTFWVCSGCEATYGLVGVRYAEWPEWVKLLVRTSRRQHAISSREEPFSVRGYDPFEQGVKR